MRLPVGASTVLMLAAFVSPIYARPEPAKTAEDATRKADIQAISDLNAAFVKAYNAKDAKAIGTLFAVEAEIEDEDGDITRGRKDIIARFTSLFAGDESGTVKLETKSLRFLGADLAIEDGVVSISVNAKDEPRTNTYTSLFSRQDGQWLQARVRDDPAEEFTAREHLQELAWLLGEWINESDDAIVHSTCKWSKDGNFLLREFDIKVQGKVSLSGTQRIGWDPQQNQFRVWVFDTGGSFADGTMSRDGDRWVIKAKGVRSDGKSVTATNSITLLNKDRIRWETQDRTLGGIAVPESLGFFLVRRPPAPGK